jgi:hypothetical protein
MNMSVPDDELSLWQVSLTSPDTSEIEATRGTLVVPTLNGVSIVIPKTPRFDISGDEAPPIDEEAPDYPAPPDWVQPLGAHDAYALGDLVTHDEQTWVSTIDANVWEPGVSSWRPTVESGPAPWVQPTGAHDAYALGDIVTHNGQTWVSTTPANVWEPGVFGWVIDE